MQVHEKILFKEYFLKIEIIETQAYRRILYLFINC